jgi:hypothetical protein
MATLLEILGELIGTNWKHRDAARRHSRTFWCRCGNHIFRNSQAPLGYLPGDAKLVPSIPARSPEPGRGGRRDATEALHSWIEMT